MTDIHEMILDESSTNPNRQILQTILRLMEMSLHFCFIFMHGTLVLYRRSLFQVLTFYLETWPVVGQAEDYLRIT